MELEFWHQRWASNQIGFHEGQVNAYLARYYADLRMAGGQTVFVPLCGKSIDLRLPAEREKAAEPFLSHTLQVESARYLYLLKPQPRDQGGETA